MWKSAGPAPSLQVSPWHICLTTEEKARKNLSQGKKNLSQVEKKLRVQYTYYQNTHTNTDIEKDVSKIAVVVTVPCLWSFPIIHLFAFFNCGVPKFTELDLVSLLCNSPSFNHTGDMRKRQP
jgi:hypothetical protein